MRFVVIVALTFQYTLVHSQILYFVESNKFMEFDVRSCQKVVVHDMNFLGEPSLLTSGLSFHPDGNVYMLGNYGLIRFNPVKRSYEVYQLNNIEPVTHIVVSEEGQTILGGPSASSTIYDYNLRENKINNIVHVGSLPVDAAKYVIAILQDNKYIVLSIAGKNAIGIWEPDHSRFYSIPLQTDMDGQINSGALYYPACEQWNVIGFSFNEGLGFHTTLTDTIHKEIEFLCDEDFLYSTTPTDFRQSPLRIDLDGDNSSGHIAAGYYDTLTTCLKEAPVVDDDVELYTCGSPGSSGKVDFISFRLKYFDQPRLPTEEIYSVDFPDQLRQTAPDRYVWQNPYEYDEIKIKEFLRSLRYRADWDPADAEQSRERVVAVTMHVDGDSTSSWTVYQLEQSEVYAGRDTMVEYCTEQVSLDLRSYLSTGVDPDAGTFTPEPSGGGSLFVPGTDEDGDYLYVIARDDCRDTAVITLSQAGGDNPGLDTVILCPGESRRIGFPPGKYSSITWWDGSSGDSILVSEPANVQRHVEVVFQRCTIYMPVEIIVRSVDGLAGRDTVIMYCADGGPLTLVLPDPPEGGSSRIQPPLAGGNMTFTPGTDAPGEYRYIVFTGTVPAVPIRR